MQVSNLLCCMARRQRQIVRPARTHQPFSHLLNLDPSVAWKEAALNVINETHCTSRTVMIIYWPCCYTDATRHTRAKIQMMFSFVLQLFQWELVHGYIPRSLRWFPTGSSTDRDRWGKRKMFDGCGMKEMENQQLNFRCQPLTQKHFRYTENKKVNYKQCNFNRFNTKENIDCKIN